MSTHVPYKRKVKMLEPERRPATCPRRPRRPRNCVFPWNLRIGLVILRYMPDRLFDWCMRWAGPEALHVEF